MVSTNYIDCNVCKEEIAFDEEWLPVDPTLACRNPDGSDFFIHLGCYTDDLELA